MDTIVIGAGLAGLAAAKELAREGRSFILLEARDRIGGRVHSLRSEQTRMPIELGAEWIEAKGEVARIIKEEEGVELRRSEGGFVQRSRDGLKNTDRNFDEALQLARKLDRDLKEDRSLSEALASVDAKDREKIDLLLYYVKSFHAADPDRLSVQWLREVEAEHSADAAEMHCTFPLDILCRSFTRHFDPSSIHLSTVVNSIEWSAGSVAVHAERSGKRSVHRSRNAIITLPLSLLQRTEGTGAVRFDPPLREKTAALSRLAMGDVIKMVLIFDEPFWMELDGAQDALFLSAPDQPVPTFWTTSPENEPVLTAWVAGSLADRITDRSPVKVLAAAIDSLSCLLSLERSGIAARLRSWHYHDWIGDPLARGAYSYVMPGGLDAHAELAKPIANTLFFAGEATAGEGANATMEGAILSGVRAAREVLAS